MKGVDSRGGKPRFYKKKAVEAAEELYGWLLAPHRPKVPLAGPVELILVFTWPHLEKTAKSRLLERRWKTTRPDLDNAAKALVDQMVKMGFFVDDALIVRCILEKWHGPDPGIDVFLRVLP